MRGRFKVQPISFEDIHALPDGWSLSDFRNILEALELDDAGDLGDDELRDLCLMALTDLEPEKAAALLLHHRLGATLRKGQIEDIAHDMLDEPLWEDYPDMRVHEELYNVNQLLYDAYDGKFPRPRSVRVELRVKALDTEGEAMLAHPTDALVVRLLAGGLTQDCVLHRLFEDQVTGAPFPEASSIVWRCDHTRRREREAYFVVYGSTYWLQSWKEAREYDVVAFPDAT